MALNHPPPAESDSAWKRSYVCLGGPCTSTWWLFTYDHGLPDFIQEVSSEHPDSGMTAFILVRFTDSLSIEAVADRLARQFGRQPSRISADSIVWLDGRHTVRLTPRSTRGTVAVVGPLRDRGHRRAALSPNERWRLCLDGNVAMCTGDSPGDRPMLFDWQAP